MVVSAYSNFAILCLQSSILEVRVEIQWILKNKSPVTLQSVSHLIGMGFPAWSSNGTLAPSVGNGSQGTSAEKCPASYARSIGVLLH